MNDVDQLLVANLIEALRQIQQYILLALGTSAAAMALVMAPRAGGGKNASVTVHGIPVAIHPGIAFVVLVVICSLAGAMASFAAHTANATAQVIGARPTGGQEVLRAATTFPSIATSPYMSVRYIAVLLPPFLSLGALLRMALKERPVAWDAVRGWAILLAAAYLPLALELRRPIGAS